MQYSKENRNLFCAALVLPLFLLYLDKLTVSFLKTFYHNSALHGSIETVEPFIRFISHGATLISIAFILYLAGRFLNQRLYSLGRSVLIGFISASVLVQVLKHLIGRARPRLTDNLIFIGPSIKSGYDSFPSGHVTVVFCLAYILSHHFPRYKIFFYLVAVITGLERIEDIYHFPSDVLAGAIVGIATAKLLSLKVFSSKSPAVCDNLREVER
jgi:membrane-associated phospholipid phosphatase